MESLDPGASSTGRHHSCPPRRGSGSCADITAGWDWWPTTGATATTGATTPPTPAARCASPPRTSHAGGEPARGRRRSVRLPPLTSLPRVSPAPPMRRSTTRTERRELLTSPPPPHLATTDPRAGRAPFDGGRQGGASQPGSEAQPRAGDAGGGAAVLRVRRRWVACTREENKIFLRLSSTASPSALTPSFLPLSPVRPP